VIIEEQNNPCFIVRETRPGRPLGYFYYDDEPHRRSVNKRLTEDEARRIDRQVR
jgi:hypothetical protein